ncbi:DUF488 domain-containing protein [Thermosulfurimonas marina]|uniref:DUF488 domain-containing protein n=1 Tax=Thermosulfurimonas marina TaxID=2047767 RepID=A0A6H1WUV8_9BACT|nr:DUF488 domain-containing protein [Thermosulfurimonas marina]
MYTVGHSTHRAEEFLRLLKRRRVRTLADIRRWPSSRRFPHFRAEALRDFLTAHGILYRHFPALGGWRKPRPDSPNTGLTSPGFRGYADHMESPEFQEALSELLDLARREPTALMCAEGLPWRCHRWFLSDLLLVRGLRVLHILPDGNLREHRLHPLARRKGDRVVYPAPLNLSK